MGHGGFDTEGSTDYRQLFENAPIGIVNAALDGTPLMVNERAALSFGYESPDDFLVNVRSMLDLWVDPGDRQRAAEVMLTTGVLRDFEVVVKRRDGSHMVLSVSSNPWRDADGNTIGIQTSGIEITDRVEAERRLEEAQAQASIGFWSWRLDSGEVSWSPQVAQIFGIAPDVTDPPPFVDLVHPEDRDLTAMTLATFRREPGQGFEVTFRIVTPAGDVKWLIARAKVAQDGLQVSGSFQDVTQQKQVEAKLTELNELKTEFVGVVAHDLRSPLTVATGYTSFLLDNWQAVTEDDRHRSVETIKRSLERLRVLVADVLEVTKIDAGGTHIEPRPFDLAEVVRSVATDVGSLEPDRSCSVDVSDPLPLAMADRESIWRVTTNLLSNAVKYSPASEPIDIEVARWRGMLKVSVRDRGPGIDTADQSRLFRKFSRLATEGPRPDGTGLGLYICKSLVEASGGAIWVDSAPGAGSTFSFTVPTAA